MVARRSTVEQVPLDGHQDRADATLCADPGVVPHLRGLDGLVGQPKATWNLGVAHVAMLSEGLRLGNEILLVPRYALLEAIESGA